MGHFCPPGSGSNPDPQHWIIRLTDLWVLWLLYCRVYECHVGISSWEGKVNTYTDFTAHMLPRIGIPPPPPPPSRGRRNLDTKPQMSSLLLFNRVYRLEILYASLIFFGDCAHFLNIPECISLDLQLPSITLSTTMIFRFWTLPLGIM